jgi:hypothetical protein
MDDAWEAVRNARLDGRKLADTFMSLPSPGEYPTYFEEVSKPMDLASIRSRIDEQKYRRWEQFEKDMLLVFSNAKSFHDEGSSLWEDAHALEKIFLAQRTPSGFRKQDKRQSGGARKRARTSRAATLEKKEVPTTRHQLTHILDAVCDAKDGDRQLAQEFLQLPEHLEPLEPFPEPLTEPPELPSGEEDAGPFSQQTLPKMEELRTWTRASQVKFWEYRRSLYKNRMKASELMRECRKRDIYPGGDKVNIIDRLLRFDFCRGQLIERELWTEEQHNEELDDIGRVYYEVISDPIDITMIRSKLEAGEYEAAEGGAVAALEADLTKLFNNAKTFVLKAGGDGGLTDDADALASVMRKAVKEMESVVKNVEKHNEAVALQASSSGAASESAAAGVAATAAAGRSVEHAAAAPISPLGAPDGASRGASSGSVLAGEWSEEEDTILIKLVREHGVGDWNAKVEMLGTGRSSTAIRKRWKKLSSTVDFIPRAVTGAGGTSAPAPQTANVKAGLSRNEVMRNALAAVRATKDGSGRFLCEIFEELPSAEEYPDYFELISNPIDLETIEENITKKCVRERASTTVDIDRPSANLLPVLSFAHASSACSRPRPVLRPLAFAG